MPALVELVLHLVPERRLAQRASTRSQLAAAQALVEPQAVATLSKIDIGNGVGLLEDHPDPAPQIEEVQARREDVLAVEQDLARGALVPDRGRRSG